MINILVEKEMQQLVPNIKCMLTYRIIGNYFLEFSFTILVLSGVRTWTLICCWWRRWIWITSTFSKMKIKKKEMRLIFNAYGSRGCKIINYLVLSMFSRPYSRFLAHYWMWGYIRRRGISKKVVLMKITRIGI